MRICFVGESFVNGTGDRTFLGWTGRLCQALTQQGHAVTYYNLGIRRETSTELRQRWQAEVARRSPPNCDNRLVFCFGVNDTAIVDGKTRVSLSDSIQNVQQILSVAQANYPVLLISPLVVANSEHNDRTEGLVRQFAHCCRELDIPYFDGFTPLKRSRRWLQEAAAGDGAHPDAGGYAELADLIQNWDGWSTWFERA